MIKNLYEVFDEIANEKSVVRRREILKENESDVLKQVLQGAFHPSIKFILPSIPPYKPSEAPAGMSYIKMNDVMQRIYLFVEGSVKTPTDFSAEKRSNLLIEWLENLEAKEALVLLGMLRKNLAVRYLTPGLINDVFPGLIPS